MTIVKNLVNYIEAVKAVKEGKKVTYFEKVYGYINCELKIDGIHISLLAKGMDGHSRVVPTECVLSSKWEIHEEIVPINQEIDEIDITSNSYDGMKEKCKKMFKKRFNAFMKELNDSIHLTDKDIKIKIEKHFGIDYMEY